MRSLRSLSLPFFLILALGWNAVAGASDISGQLQRDAEAALLQARIKIEIARTTAGKLGLTGMVGLLTKMAENSHGVQFASARFCGPNTRMYVSRMEPDTIYLCEEKLSEFERAAYVQMIIHELVHTTGNDHEGDASYYEVAVFLLAGEEAVLKHDYHWLYDHEADFTVLRKMVRRCRCVDSSKHRKRVPPPKYKTSL